MMKRQDDLNLYRFKDDKIKMISSLFNLDLFK